MIRVAFDIGGTFTDFVLHDGDGRSSHFLKVPSTPHDPAEAVLDGLAKLFDLAEVEAADIANVLHATTVATNAVLERKGAATGLITTEGFRDVLIIGRQKRYETYDLYIAKPEPLVPRRHIVEVAERLDQDGVVVQALNETSLDRAIDALLASGRETVAVCLLHAYANPAHEQAIRARIVERAPGLAVSLSSDVAPKFREYERSNTTAANAYIKPIVENYIGQLELALQQKGFARELFIMQSNGGLVSPGIAKDYPIRIIESGPAAGVLMGGIVGREAGREHVITFDMGGTTAKLGAVDDGTPAIMPTFEIDHIRYKKGSGLPINVPAVELLEIGAGGGSIARVEMGMIAVGPESAGADPGPICYGRGGAAPTITDANLVLGYIDPDWFNGGTMALDMDAAARGIMAAIGAPLDLELGAAAWGIHLVATMNMENALRIVSVEQGRDPRRYAMIAFGGAGPMHAARLARAVGIPEVIVPQGAGIGSAIGLLQAAPRIDVSTTRVMELNQQAGPAIADVFGELEVRARQEIDQFDSPAPPEWSRHGYMRYVGQGFEVRVDLPDGPIDQDFADRAIEAFNGAYLQKHKFLDPEARIEAVDWTLVATLPSGQEDSAIVQQHKPDAPARNGSRPAWFPEAGGYVETRIIDRQALAEGASIAGPAIIEDPDSTTVVLPGDVARISSTGHLIIDIGKEVAA
ncbi:MAG: hydantoinase/oxoprolinase family protein [Alphaproteobacteria bacterium]|nr:hydantoinase/oxoprolinase family protein [Alphaproteobacteria bacterium]